MQEICDLLTELGAETSIASSVADFYIVDIAIKGNGECRGLVLDSTSNASAPKPYDPWAVLKLRHLTLLGHPVAWLPTQRWRAWDDAERRAFLGEVIQSEDKTAAA